MPKIQRDGAEIWWDVRGAPDAPPLVLAAGLGGTHGWWAPQIEAYAREFRVLVFDQRGTGNSSRVPVASVGQMAEDLAAVMDAAGMKRAAYLGHSTGGAIGVALALAEPQRLSRMVVYASTTHGDAYRHRVFALRKILMERAGSDAYARYTTLLLHPPYWINANEARIAADEAAAAGALGDPVVQGSRLDAILAFDPRADLPRLKPPLMVLCADDDILTPRYFSEEMAALVPGAYAVFVPRGGHALSRTEPALFDSIVLPFLREAP